MKYLGESGLSKLLTLIKTKIESLTASDVGAIPATNGAVGTSNIANSAVTSGKIASTSVGTSKLIDNAITSAKLADGSVIEAKVGDSAITSNKVKDAAITSAKLADGSVTSGKISSSAVTNGEIADGAITYSKIAENSVGMSRLIDGAVSADKIAYGALVAIKNFSVENSEWTENSYGTYNKTVTINGIDPAKHIGILMLQRSSKIPDVDTTWTFTPSILDLDDEKMSCIFGCKITAANELLLTAKEIPSGTLYLTLAVIHI